MRLMQISQNFFKIYFDIAYNRVYDFTTARTIAYDNLQKTCVNKLSIKDSDLLLCAGLGTGNEIAKIFSLNANVKICGVDFSKRALNKAYAKALKLGKEIEVLEADVRHLKFQTGTFDHVLCIHLMDFVKEPQQITQELLRTLRAGGKFVVTFPSNSEGVKLGLSILKEEIDHNRSLGKSFLRSSVELTARFIIGLVYIPILFRRGKKYYSHSELDQIIQELNPASYKIEEFPIYGDFIVSGSK